MAHMGMNPFGVDVESVIAICLAAGFVLTMAWVAWDGWK